MPSQWELETAERLGGIDSKLERVLDALQPTERRLNSLEKTRSYALGWFAAMSFVVMILGWIVYGKG